MPEPVSVSDARARISEIIAFVQSNPEPVYLTRHGKRVAAVISAEELDRVLDLAEDMEDIRAAGQARAEMVAAGSEPIPWEEVRAELGLE